MEKEEADAGRDRRTYPARPNSKEHGDREKTCFSCSADQEQGWQTYSVDPYPASSRVRVHALPAQHLLRGSYKRGLHKFQRGRGEATAGESALATSLWGMRYADDAGVVSQSPTQLRNMMGVIVIVYAAFGFTVSEANTEIMCYARRGYRSTPPYSA